MAHSAVINSVFEDWKLPRAQEARKRNVMILYTGGTIGMKVVNGSLAPCRGYLQEEMMKMQEFSEEERYACPPGCP